MSDSATSLCAISFQAEEKIQTGVLCSCFFFPANELLKKHEPAMAIEVEGKINFKNIISNVDQNVETIALGVRKDLKLVLLMMEKINSDLLLDEYDSIQIYRKNSHILKINFKANNVGRSAIVDIDEYRQKLRTTIESKSRISYSKLLIVGFTIGIVVIIITLV